MKRNDEICEFDGYDFSHIPVNTKPLTKEEEDKLMAEVLERVKKRKALQDAREAQRALENEANNAAPNVSIMEVSR